KACRAWIYCPVLRSASAALKAARCSALGVAVPAARRAGGAVKAGRKRGSGGADGGGAGYDVGWQLTTPTPIINENTVIQRCQKTSGTGLHVDKTCVHAHIAFTVRQRIHSQAATRMESFGGNTTHPQQPPTAPALPSVHCQTGITR